jgi:hypothetical protein
MAAWAAFNLITVKRAADVGTVTEIVTGAVIVAAASAIAIGWLCWAVALLLNSLVLSRRRQFRARLSGHWLMFLLSVIVIFCDILLES